MNNIKKLNIHLDINRTIIFGDDVKGEPIEKSIIETMSDLLWGHEENGQFVIDVDKFLTSPPFPNLLSFTSFTHRLFPFKTPQEIPDAKKRSEFNYNLKRTSHLKLKENFFSKGNPGFIFDSFYHKILNGLKAPAEESSVKNEFLRELYYTQNKGHLFVFKSVFFLIEELIQKSKEKKTEFLVLLRTFGQDYVKVKEEINLFLKGKHPVFSASSEDEWEIKEEDFCLFYRYEEGDYLVVGEKNRVKKPEKGEELERLYKFKTILKGRQAIHKFIINKTGFLIISDDYDFWDLNDRKTDCGKLFYVDGKNDKIFDIFFDDNIKKGAKSIVSCVNFDDGKSCGEGVFGRNLIRANALEAASDEEYFWKVIEQNICNFYQS